MTSEVLERVARRLSKLRRQAASFVVTPYLALRSAGSRRSLIDPSNTTVVCLTSYGPRLRTVHLTIESIARGKVRPKRLILWTDPDIDDDSLPETLTRLRARGLEILVATHHFGPHTKYYPYVASQETHLAPLVTADDDSVYPRYWLARLQRASQRHPYEVLCYRAHKVRLTTRGEMAPYNTWDSVRGTKATLLNFGTGVSGVHYPAQFLDELRRDGTRFLETCPRADDVWLHSRAVAHGRPIRQITKRPRKYPELRASQDSALHLSNTGQSANDAQISATYTTAELQALVQQHQREVGGPVVAGNTQ